MGTLATLLGRTDAVAAETRQPIVHSDPHVLRALPNEDIYFFSKRIDNSRVVREADPAAGTKCWSAIGGVCLLAAVLIASAAPRLAGIVQGYQLESLKQEQQRLLDERKRLEVEEARLLSPERLEALARSQKLTSPAPGQVVFLEPKADGSLALNLVSK